MNGIYCRKNHLKKNLLNKLVAILLWDECFTYRLDLFKKRPSPCLKIRHQEWFHYSQLENIKKNGSVLDNVTVSCWMKTKRSISAQRPHGVMILGFFCRHRTWVTHWVDHELISIPKYSRFKHVAICPSAKAWPKLGHVPEPWSQRHMQMYHRMPYKKIK